MEALTASDFYASILRSVGCAIHPDSGYVHILDGSTVNPPLTINKKQVLLPTQAVLRNGLTNDQIGFAPAGESVIRRESLVMKKLRELVTARITYVTMQVLEGLMDIAADHSKHPLLTPEQSEFLSVVPEVNEKTVQELSSVLDKIDNKGDNRLIQIYIKSNGKMGDQVYKRLASVSFPIMEARQQEGHKIFGVGMRKANKKAVLDLLNWVFPNCEVAGTWNAGSHDMAAPSFQALMLAYGNLIERLNAIVELFGTHLSGPIPLYSELLWWEGINDIAKWRAAIPTLPGNDGEIVRDSVTGATPTTEQPTQPVVSPATVTAAPAAPAAAKPAPVVQSNGLMSIARPINEAKGFNRPAAAPQQGFTVVEPAPVPPVTYAPPQVQGRVQPATMTWAEKQAQLQAQQANQPVYNQPVAYNNSGYAVGGYAAPQPAAYNPHPTAYQPQPQPYNPHPQAYAPTPPPVPAHLAHLVISFAADGTPFDQFGQIVPPEVMLQLGYRMEQVPVAPAPGYGQQYPLPPSQQLPPGRAAGLANLEAQKRYQNQQQQHQAYYPPRY